MAVVIAVIGLVVALGMPVFHTSPLRVDAAVAKVASDIRYAQQLAMSTHRHVWVVFNTSTDSYSLYIEPENPGSSINKAGRIAVGNPHDAGAYSVAFGAGEYTGIDITVAAFEGKSELEFNTLGEPFDGDNNPLTSGTADRVVINTRQITVVPGTGALEIGDAS